MIVRNNYSIIAAAYNEALKSPCNYRLGSVITKGRRRIVMKGYNTNQRTSYLKQTTCCQHAEMAVVTKFMNGFVRRNYKNSYKNRSKKRSSRHDFSKYIIWVYRIPSGCIHTNSDFTNKLPIRNAMPCKRCCESLLKLGFRKIGYSTKDNTTVLRDLRRFKNDHVSVAERKMAHLSVYI